ncbi:MAG TPA: anaerobic ribonucleoside-triphosphate reductase activating protein, partial [Clostridiales bacterium]|nr:anaerobic ribonucleoside-triphosphate reductase activating protein [Clostridiales bacterium]
MKFHGFQKMTVLDYPGHIACTAFTGGCNLRCPFCHNASLVTELVSSATIEEEEILSFLEKRKGLLDGIAITGGEPLLHPDIPAFIKEVKALGFSVKLDTNGCYPAVLKQLVEEKLVDYVAVDIKNCPEKYAETVGVPDFDLAPVLETVAYLKTDPVEYEFRTTVVKEFHTEEDMRKIADWIAGTQHYFLQNFTDSGNLIGTDMQEAGKETMQRFLTVVREKI